MSMDYNYVLSFPVTTENGENYGDFGISIRDYFAAKAMQALLTTITQFPDEHWRKGIAIDSYSMDDAMIDVRES